MSKWKKRIATGVLLLTMALAAVGCGGSDENEYVEPGSKAESNIVNVGVTDSLGGLNPLTVDQTEINKNAIGLMFLPLMDLDDELNFQPMLADSITTEDNLNFIVHIDEDAYWSDGTAVTAEDLEFTIRRMASPVINNTTTLLYAFEGIGDDGFVEENAQSISGIQILDEKTVQFTAKESMSLTTFLNTYARYINTLPKHVLGNYSEKELMTLDWFNSPDVINGPYMVTDYDADHYISYTANTSAWRGVPKIEKLNIKIMDGSQIYAALQSGEVDITHHTLTSIPLEDFNSVEDLDNVEVKYGIPVTNQSVFIQTENIPDARIRQALVYAIDRERILNQLMDDHGEIVDGFLSSASPYFDESIVPMEYNPEKARELVEEADWKQWKKLKIYVNSGDNTFLNAVQLMVSQWAEVGIKVEIKTVNLSTLMTIAGSKDYDLMAVQYTYAPLDPHPDISWLLSGEGSWTGYSDEEITDALAVTQNTDDEQEIKEAYSLINQIVQEDVPMFSAYVISAQGAVSKRLSGAQPSVYGFFNNVHNWEIIED